MHAALGVVECQLAGTRPFCIRRLVRSWHRACCSSCKKINYGRRNAFKVTLIDGEHTHMQVRLAQVTTVRDTCEHTNATPCVKLKISKPRVSSRTAHTYTYTSMCDFFHICADFKRQKITKSRNALLPLAVPAHPVCPPAVFKSSSPLLLRCSFRCTKDLYMKFCKCLPPHRSMVCQSACVLGQITRGVFVCSRPP